MPSKMVSFEEHDDEKSTAEEFEILAKSLKSGQKLATLSNFLYPADYTDQLMAENYLDGLLEGYTLKFVVNSSIDRLKDVFYLTFEDNKRRIYQTMCGVIERRGLKLRFERACQRPPPLAKF